MSSEAITYQQPQGYGRMHYDNSSSSIPLQILSVPGTASQHQSQCNNHTTPAQTQVVYLVNQQHPSQASATATPTAWLWSRGCSIWNWLMSIVMLALTAAGLVAARLQASLQTDISPTARYDSELKGWRAHNEYLDRCNAEKKAGNLIEGCQSALEKGLSPPPKMPPILRQDVDAGESMPSSSSSKSASNVRTKLEKTFHQANTRLARVKHILSRFSKSVTSLRGLKRRTVRLFRGGRRLSNGHFTVGLPTLNSTLSALSSM